MLGRKLRFGGQAVAGAKLAGLERQALHAARLTFVHPVTGTLMEFNSPLPEDLAEIAVTFKQL